MSTKHNTKHLGRGTSHYPERLQARGLSKTPEMATLDHLRSVQNRRIRQTCTLGDGHDFHECDGLPFPQFSAEDAA